MPKPLSTDLRERVIAAYKKGGLTQPQVAELFGIGEASVKRWWRLDREKGSVEPKPHRSGPQPKVDEAAERVLRQLVDERNDLTREEYAELLEERTGLLVSPATLGRTLRKLGYTRKKRRLSPAKA